MPENLSSQTDEALHRYYDVIFDRIASEDAKLHAFCPGTFDRERICEQLDDLLARHPDPSSRPPLFAVPIGIKDIIHCDSFETRCGSALPPQLFQGPEAGAVKRLKEAGAVIMGKTATTEFAYFAPAATRNPVNPEHTPGGSSSGSAAGVAAGFFQFAIGTQTVGSVIRPAAYCGVAGFKPSFGRIDISGVVPFSPSADHVGAFGRTMSGLMPFLKILCRNWKDRPAPDQPRLGIPAGPYLDQADPAALDHFHLQADRLIAAGCDVVEIPLLDDITDINERHSRLIAAEFARIQAPWFEAQQHLYRPATRDIITKGMTVPDSDMESLRPSCYQLRSSLTQTMADQKIDAWICPATTGEAPKGLETTGSPLMNLPWTHSGVPAVTLPAGTGPAGLPLGLQLVAGWMADEHLAAMAVQLETMIA